MTQPNLAEQMLPAMATIRGDLRDGLIGALTQMTKPWKDMPEHEQLQLAQILDAHAQAIVTRIAILTATAGRPTVLATLDKIVVEDQGRATLVVPKEQAAALVPYARQIVAVMAVGPNQFAGERRPVETMPDQPALPMGDAEPPQRPASPGTATITISGGGSGAGGAFAGHARNSEADAEREDREVRPMPKQKTKPKAKPAAPRKIGSPFAQ